MPNGAIYLPNCTGKLVIEHNTIYNILSSGTRSGIEVLNQNIPVSSEILIKKNSVSNIGDNAIFIGHNSPSGDVEALVKENQVFNVGQTGDGYFIGTQGSTAGGRLLAKIEENFCQNTVGFNMEIQSTGTAHVHADVKRNKLQVASVVGFAASSHDSSHLCLKLVRNTSDAGYSLTQAGSSVFKLNNKPGNIGLPFVTSGTIQNGKCL